MIIIGVVMETFRKAKLEPTARASMLVALEKGSHSYSAVLFFFGGFRLRCFDSISYGDAEASTASPTAIANMVKTFI